MRADALKLPGRPGFDGFALLLYGAAALLSVTMIAFATTLRPIWMVLISVGLLGGFTFLGLPEKKIVLWCLYLLTLQLSAGKWVTLKPRHYFGENPDGFVLFMADLPLFLLLAWWFAELALGKARMVMTPPLKPMLAWLVWRALTVLVAPNKGMALWNVLYHVKFVLLYLWVTSNVKDRRWVYLTTGLFMTDLIVQGALTVTSWVIKGAVTVFGIKYYALQEIGGQEVFRATGTLGSHNIQTQFFEMTVPLAAIVLYRAKNLWVRVVAFVALVGGLLGTFTTFSRGGWIGVLFAFGLATAILARARLLGPATISSMVLVGAIGLGGFLFIAPRTLIGKRLLESPRVAVESRWAMAQAGLRMIGQHPLMGVGTNNAALVERDYFPDGVPWYCEYPIEGKLFVIPIHNKFVLIAVEHGLVGFSLFMWFLGSSYGCAFKCLRGDDPWLAAFGGWILAAFTAVWAHNMISEFSHLPMLEFFFLMCALAASMAALGTKAATPIAGAGEALRADPIPRAPAWSRV